VQRQALDLVRSVIHTAPADHQGVAVWHVSTLQRVTNVKYALSQRTGPQSEQDDTCSPAPQLISTAMQERYADSMKDAYTNMLK